MGIPREAVELENKAVNTEENAKFVRDILVRRGECLTQSSQSPQSNGLSKLGELSGLGARQKPRVLLVTSACHMKRSLNMFKKYAPEIECIPAATDYQALPWKDNPFKWRHILPDIGALARNNSYIHEYIGYYGYKWFR